jgi:signal transduction histidine kinase
VKRPRLSVRAKLTALYGGLFLLAGIALLVTNYLLVSGSLPDSDKFAVAVVQRQELLSGKEVITTTAPPPGQPVNTPGAVHLVSHSLDEYGSSALTTLTWRSSVALALAAALSVLLGYVVAGRVLRPLHSITSTARKLEAGDLHRRINLDGPEDELKELADTFDGMLDRLAESFDSQKRFVANASHELRTPLAVQRTLVEVAMADPSAGPEVRRLGRQLLHTNERSERMIEGLLLLARSDRGLRHRSPVRLDELVAGVLRTFADSAAEHEVTVRSELPARVVHGDPVLLERMVGNLVQNAIGYNEPGGSVWVTVGPDPALEVRNTGARIRSELVPALFEPFRRLERDRTGGGDGAGLGLSIVGSIVRAHDGQVTARPGERGGLEVAVRLPGDGESTR